MTSSSRLTEHGNIFLITYPVAVFSHLSLQPFLPFTRSQQCFTTAATLLSHFEKLELPLKSNNLIRYAMQCAFPSWNSLKCYSRKNLNCQVHQNMKPNAGLLTNSNSKTILMHFMLRKNAQ